MLLLLALYLVASYFFGKMFVRIKDDETYERTAYEFMCRNGQEKAVERTRQGRKYLDSLNPVDVYITSYDGLRLRGRYVKNGDSHRTAILIHGYNSFVDNDFSCAFELYYSFGVNLLLIDHRAHRQSEGKYICFGARERYDVRDWCRWLVENDPDCKIILSGISMGCTTALLASVLPDMPKNLSGVIADCGYVSPRDEFVHVMKNSLHLPTFPLLNIAERIAKHRAGFGFSDFSTLDAVKQLHLPVLFIHGEADDFVLPENTRLNYEACVSERKKLIIVPEAKHGMSFLTDEPRCSRELKEFFESI